MIRQIDGRPAYAYTGGKPWEAGPGAVVFIHGALNDHSVWNLLARWFAHHGRPVLAVDLPGHGRSEGPPLGSIEALADWIIALLDATGQTQAALVGHSMGSLVALEAAARAPTRATALGLVATAYPMKVSPALLQTALDDPLKAIDMVNAWSISTTAAKPSFPGPGAWLHGGNRALMRRIQAGCTGTNLFAHDFRLCDAYATGLAAAAAVKCPARVITGTDDQMTPPRSAEALAVALNAPVTRIAAGHALMQEAPDPLLAALRRLLPT